MSGGGAPRWEEVVARLRRDAHRGERGRPAGVHIVVRRSPRLRTSTYRGPYPTFEAALAAVAAELRADTTDEDHEYTIAPLDELPEQRSAELPAELGQL